MASDPETLAPEQRLGEKYEIVDVIGVGGMGTVYEGRHLRLGHAVAIKVLNTDAGEREELFHRFEREARAAAKLTGRHVARVTDVDALEDGSPYMVMEYLEGCDLSFVLEERGPLSVTGAVDLLLQTCTAMSEAHAAGIIHRDLKPGNLFLTERDGQPCIKVLDFGISKVVEEESVSVTMTTSVLGTPLYMSPEQIRSAKHVDERSDIWSLGVILYELLTGTAPFDGSSPTAVIAAITADEPKPISEIRPEVSPALDAVVRRALEKDPAQRFQSVDELAHGLAPFGSEGRWTVTTSGARVVPAPRSSGPEAVARTQHDTHGAWEAGQTTPSRRRWWPALAAALVVGASVGGYFALADRGPAQSAAPPDEPAQPVADTSSERAVSSQAGPAEMPEPATPASRSAPAPSPADAPTTAPPVAPAPPEPEEKPPPPPPEPEEKPPPPPEPEVQPPPKPPPPDDNPLTL